MNNYCKFARSRYCMCNTCKAVREAIEEVEKITKEEADKLFCDAEKLLKNIEISEKENEKNGRK